MILYGSRSLKVSIPNLVIQIRAILERRCIHVGYMITTNFKNGYFCRRGGGSQHSPPPPFPGQPANILAAPLKPNFISSLMTLSLAHNPSCYYLSFNEIKGVDPTNFTLGCESISNIPP